MIECEHSDALLRVGPSCQKQVHASTLFQQTTTIGAIHRGSETTLRQLAQDDKHVPTTSMCQPLAQTY